MAAAPCCTPAFRCVWLKGPGAGTGHALESRAFSPLDAGTLQIDMDQVPAAQKELDEVVGNMATGEAGGATGGGEGLRAGVTAACCRPPPVSAAMSVAAATEGGQSSSANLSSKRCHTTTRALHRERGGAG